MARIPDAELERLKREVSLTRLIEAQGLKLATQGKDLACRCPWHEGDDTPSCIVSPKTNLWHCFGCDAGGSLIDWVMRMHKVSFRHACELLAKQHPALAAATSTSPAPATTAKLSQGKLRTAQSFSQRQGTSTRAISAELGVSQNTVRKYLRGAKKSRAKERPPRVSKPGALTKSAPSVDLLIGIAARVTAKIC